ncbi:hypothetical protein ACFFF7_04955 [Novosphingobium aquiterrae]|uniref:Uncharacterized protein n=1 Tax=Novosphingobium aquiterrae TaxID=624388 RepID=A0ABV6PFY6_9SPHN
MLQLRKAQQSCRPLHFYSLPFYLHCDCGLIVRQSKRRNTMRSIVATVLPFIAAASLSGLMFTATLV